MFTFDTFVLLYIASRGGGAARGTGRGGAKGRRKGRSKVGVSDKRKGGGATASVEIEDWELAKFAEEIKRDSPVVLEMKQEQIEREILFAKDKTEATLTVIPFIRNEVLMEHFLWYWAWKQGHIKNGAIGLEHIRSKIEQVKEVRFKVIFRGGKEETERKKKSGGEKKSSGAKRSGDFCEEKEPPKKKRRLATQ